MKKYTLILGLICFFALLVARCQEPTQPLVTEASPWLNHHDSVGYVGIETCKSCHADIYETFIHTGMGQSFDVAHRAKSAGDFQGKQIYDSILDLYYRPFWQGDSLYLQEYRLQGGDTVHHLTQKIDYIIGSGQHTNSHLFKVGDQVFQAPFTWYAQEGKLDLPPGFENGANSRFSRLIGLECMACHNAMPTDFKMGSTNAFSALPKGINCERCHGPGEAHVAKIMRGEITDTSTEADYSIVNPKRLSAQLQFELCQRCHLQGNSVLQEGESFFDFKPGMELKEVMDVYLARYQGADDDFIMASHADRFKASACYQSAPEAFTCTSCHNPHVSVKETNLQRFNNSCQSCHQGAPIFECTAERTALIEVGYNCVSCHMPPSSAIDIPHVTVHDHWIRKPRAQEIVESDLVQKQFLELKAINNPKPSARSKALAYMQQYERFRPENFYLDSARQFLARLQTDSVEALRLWTYYYHLTTDYAALAKLSDEWGISNLRSTFKQADYENRDAWTLYRLAQALDRQQRQEEALALYSQARALAPKIPDFINKQASVLSKLGRERDAEEAWNEALRLDQWHRESLNNLGFLYLQQGRWDRGKALLERCLKRYPDYEMAWLNYASWALQQGEDDQLIRSLQEVLRINPANQTAQQFMQSLGS